jgi:flavodoxin
MRALVVFDSLFGNTEEIARAIGEALATVATVDVIPASQVSWPDCSELDLVVFGGPTQRRGLSPAMHALLSGEHVGRCCGLPAAAFDTRFHMTRLLTGSAAEAIERRLEALGCQVVAPAESFYVAGREGPLLEGELERAREWALGLVARAEATPA